LFVQHRATTPDGLPAWGQYLDGPLRDQHGLFGTCAAIEVLVSEGGSPYADLAQEASSALPDLDPTTGPASDSAFEQQILAKGDFNILFKVVARAETLAPIGGRIDHELPLFEYLRHSRANGAGWATYRYSIPIGDTLLAEPSVTATAVALWALRRYVSFCGAADHSEAAIWLCRHLPATEKAPTYELALALLALEEAAAALDIEEIRGTIVKIRTELARRLSAGPVGLFLPESFEYLAPDVAPLHAKTSSEAHAGERSSEALADTAASGAIARNVVSYSYRYMFYLPEVIACLAFLRSPDGVPPRARDAVFAIVSRCEHQLHASGRLVAQGRRHASAVDHMWVHRLLHAYRECQPANVVRRNFLSRHRVGVGSVAIAGLTGGVYVLAGWVGLVAGALTEGVVLIVTHLRRTDA
jgi:hypothetical protein